MRETPDLFLEREELLECDMKTGNIKVDKQIFDDFVPNTYINIQFVDGKYDGIYQFSMVDEDDEGIFMEYLDYFDYDTPTTDRKTQEYDGLYSDKHEI